MLTLSSTLVAQPLAVDRYPIYTGVDLGCTIKPRGTFFRFWSPGASAIRVLFYKHATLGKAYQVTACEKSQLGTWTLHIPQSIVGHYYTLQVKHGDRWTPEFTDPYSLGVGTNGKRSQVINLANTNPSTWYLDKSPQYTTRNSQTDAIIYEAHIRDLTVDPSSGVKHKGKFVGLTEPNTRNKFGQPTALDHLRSIGITHLHLLPVFDFNSVDESRDAAPTYNWGYDPVHYNVPEGSYSLNPEDGHVRIREFKRLIQSLHRNGIRVVMDVVYNHTALGPRSNFNYLVPNYYYRQEDNGDWANGSGCGNEVASDRPMVRQFMLQSLEYWMREYHVDGFRFDLMGLHDTVTMQEIATRLRRLQPDVLLYGEGWAGGSSPLSETERAVKWQVSRLGGFAAFSDDLRDAIKGNGFHHDSTGFVSGNLGTTESIRFGIVAAGQHPQIRYHEVNYSKAAYTESPQQQISYAECHDNHTLWDKLSVSRPDLSNSERLRMHELALAIVLTSQGVPFLHAGTEFARSKQGVENSYKSPDSINALNWNELNTHQPLLSWMRKLIQLRKQHPAFRLMQAADVAQHLRFVDGNQPAGIVAFELNGAAVGDRWKRILVCLNAQPFSQTIEIPEGAWQVKLSNGQPILSPGWLEIGPQSANILAIE